MAISGAGRDSDAQRTRSYLALLRRRGRLRSMSAEAGDILRLRLLTLDSLGKLILGPAECPRLKRIFGNEPEQPSHAED
jgi:hypothetical protein